MISHKVKSIVKQCYLFYLIGFIIIFGLKYFYSKADSSNLIWILLPTARWVEILSGIHFTNDSQLGFINHDFRFIIAPSCSGVQFMMITIATLVYSFVHRMRTRKEGLAWMGISLAVSYFFTIFINGFRIVLSIYLPLALEKADIYHGWLTPEKLHTMIGIVVYFTSLFTIYQIAGYISQKIAGTYQGEADTDRDSCGRCSGKPLFTLICRCIPPMFWYFSIALGIPFLNKAYRNNYQKFMEYTILVSVICIMIMLIYCAASWIRSRIRAYHLKR